MHFNVTRLTFNRKQRNNFHDYSDTNINTVEKEKINMMSKVENVADVSSSTTSTASSLPYLTNPAGAKLS